MQPSDELQDKEGQKTEPKAPEPEQPRAQDDEIGPDALFAGCGGLF